MATKKRKSKGSFLARVQRSAKMKSVRAKIKKKRLELKRLSTQYKRTLKSESKRLSK